MPVLVNHNIVGGWHNIVPHVTGEFFTNENDLETALDYMTQNMENYKPRDWFIQNRSKERSGRVLSEFLIKHYPDVNNKTMRYATITI
jgi:hypothetical protein